MTAELGQLLHNNPVGAETPDYVNALIKDIRNRLATAYWNVNQKEWEASGEYDFWNEPDEHGLEPLPPGVEWKHYYNWGGSPEDADWDQAQADAPNFSFEGVEIRWYKRFGRSMNANVTWEPAKWVRWYERCFQTIRHWEEKNSRAFPFQDAVPMPSADGVVAIEMTADDYRYVELNEKLRTAEAQLNCIACVCIDVQEGKTPRFTPEDWRWCQTLDWATRLGQLALRAPDKLVLDDEESG